MSTYTITNKSTGQVFDITSGLLEIPNQGVWIMEDVSINTDEGFKDKDQVDITFMDRTLSGVLDDLVVYEGYISCTVIGGKGTLSTRLESQSWQGVSVRNIVDYIAKITSHTVSLSSDAALLATSVPRFEKLKDMASDSLSKLMSLVGGIWRIALDGTLIITKETYPDISVKYPTLKETTTDGVFFNYIVLDKNPNLGHWKIYCEDILVEPGFSIEGNKVKETMYDINIGSQQNISIYWTFFDPQHIQDYNLSQQNRDLIYLRKYRMKVISQHPTNRTVTVIPDPDLEILKNGLRDVPIMYTSPNMHINVTMGAICYVEFANGDPGRPVVSGWEDTSNLTLLEIASPASTQLSARKGDGCGYLVFTPNVGMSPAVLAYSPVVVPVVPPTILIGPIRIQEGSSKVKVGG